MNGKGMPTQQKCKHQRTENVVQVVSKLTPPFPMTRV